MIGLWILCAALFTPQINKAFTVMFVIETTFKLGLLGPIGYFTDGYNVFDFVITLLNLVESTMEVRLAVAETSFRSRRRLFYQGCE